MLKLPPAAQVKDLISKRKTRWATVAFVDLQGQLRGKTINGSKLLKGFPGGVPFSPLNLTLDYGDHSLFPRGYLSPDQDIGDNACEIDWQHPRTLPFEDADANLFFFAQFDDDTQGSLWDPRRLYQTIEHNTRSQGYRPVYGLEYEYRVLRETPETLREKSFTAIKLVSDVSTYGGVMHQSVWSGFFKEMRDMCDQMGINVASMHWEVAASMGEVALAHQEGIAALDDAILFKTHAKVLAKHHDLTLTFMARPLANADGQSGHVHMSLLNDKGNNKGKNAFHNARKEHGMSDQQYYFIGGLQKLMPELLLMLAPNINSFKRFAPGIFAPTKADWGIDNRTTAIRVLPGNAAAQRLELRTPGADANPYLVASAMLSAGMYGIEHQCSPAEPVTGASHRKKKAPAAQNFPPSFKEAIDRFSSSQFARTTFGDDFVEMFAGTRRAQHDEFARMVTDAELERFLEHA